MTDTLRNELSKASNIEQVLAIFDTYLAPPLEAPSKNHSRSQINTLAQEILERVNGKPELLTDEEREILRQYSGWGGIGGSTNEYYTPTFVAQATWNALEAYGFKNGNVLEPAAGVGVFSETKPQGVLMTSVEMNKVSGGINQLLHPEDSVVNSAFENFVTSHNTGGYDAVIGNPPYGPRDESAHKDEQYKNIKLADQYFVTRSIDKAAPGGLIALILPTRIVDRKSLSKWRRSIALKAEFLGAHRLPSDIFGASGTAVVTDLVIWRKHSAEAQDIIDAADIEQLKSANVVWNTWIDGKWFELEGKTFINGAQSIVDDGYYKRLVVNREGKTNDQIAKSLSHKFDSRIEWSELATVEPLTNSYGEGDNRLINGKMMRLEDGVWVTTSPVSVTGQINSNIYGVESDREAGISTQSPEGTLKLSFSQCKAIYDDLSYACDENFKLAMRAALNVPERHQERVFRGIMLGKMVRNLSNLVATGEENHINEYRNKISNLIATEYQQYGNTRKIKGLKSLPSEQFAEWSAFNSAFNDQGEQSDLLQGRLEKSDAKQYNLSEPDDVLLWFSLQNEMNAVSLEDFKAAYTGHLKSLSDDELLNQLSAMSNIAINSDGTLSAMHKATSGNVVKKMEQLNQSIANSTSTALTENFKRQIELIEQKRGKISINDMKMKLTDKWIPKEMILEFLHDRGYNEFMLGKFTDIDDEQQFDINYRGKDSEFTGYRFRDGKKRNDADETFERQIESYLNSGAVRGGSGNAGKAAVREQIRQLDSDFTMWAASGDYADQLEEQYNNIFNGYIEPEHDQSPLELDGVSGAIEYMGYQNATIRRHSDDGNGIIGLGTGLGKTLTGLGLIKYNQQKGRSKRTAIVVPKSVIENWFHESDLFFGEQNLSDKVFIGIEPEYDSEGKLLREPVLDEEGNPKLDKKNAPIMRAKLSVNTSSSKIAPQLHQLTQSKASIVVMTKDVYNSIPLRESTIADNVSEMVDAGLVGKSNKYVKIATKYKEKAKNDRFRAKYADEGTKKKNQLPYYEDLLFDSVLVDEGHDFRNSYKTGSYGNRLAFMPNGAQADRALDMQIKNNFIKRQNNGRGVYMLTATPTVNSPVDAFNMLSHVVPPETFAKMGITDGDDFIRLFGRTGETAVHKLSGEVDTKEALLGFQNLEALRKLFHRYVTIKDMKDVNAEVHIPELETQTNYVDMSEEQQEIYEELRARAEALSNPDTEEAIAIAEEFPDDSVFSIIRQMDKACTDLDLYKGQVTYRFPKSKESEVKSLIESIPKDITVTAPVYDEKTGKYKNQKIKVQGRITHSVEGKHFVVVANQELDSVFAQAAMDAGLEFSHPVAPKYAKFLDNAKQVYMDGGKQLVFTEEKTQHVKLARIISQFVGCKLSEIGIINSDTVAGKKGSNVDGELDEAGLEAIANEYNSGRYRFVILNKKGEVGINLHHGTTDIHHLTLPFTPASLTQRNGRGARVGSKQAKVNVHYYAGKGSFDKFRIATIERKARWIGDLFSGTEKDVENGDAADANETAIMLAADPEEARRRQAEANTARERKLQQERQRVATIALGKYLQAIEALDVDPTELESELSNLNDQIAKQELEVDEALERTQREHAGNWEKSNLKRAKKALFDLRAERTSVSKKIERRLGAESAKKRFKPQIEQAISDGILSDYQDVFSAPNQYMTSNGKVVREGYSYIIQMPVSMWDEKSEKVEDSVTVLSLDKEALKAQCILLSSNGPYSKDRVINVNLDQFVRLKDVNHSEQELISKARAGIKLSDIAHTLTREQFYQLISDEHLKEFSSTRGGIAVNGNNELLHVYEFKSDDYQMLYPDLKDAGFKNRLMDIVITEIENKGRSQFDSVMSDYVGPDWSNEVIERGNSATDEHINKRMAETFVLCENEYKESYQKALLGDFGDFESNVRSTMNNLDWSGFVNRGAIRSAVNRIFNNYYSILQERSEEHINRERDEAFAQYVKLCSNDATRTDRLEKVASLMRKYTSEHHFSKHCRSLYSSDETNAAITIYADLTAIGKVDALSDGGKLLKTPRNSVAYHAMWEYERILRMSKKTFIQNIEALVTSEKPASEDVPLTEQKTELVESVLNIPVDFDSLQSTLKEIGVTAKLNSQNLVHSWKRKRTEMTANGYIGLFDTNGRSGALAKHFAGRKNADNKTQFGAIYSADISEEFTGSWWFVPIDKNLAELTELLTS